MAVWKPSADFAKIIGQLYIALLGTVVSNFA